MPFAGVVVVLMALLVGCGKMNSAELGEKVRAEMQAELSKKSGLKGLVMESVRLVQREAGGIDYVGVGKGSLNGEQVEFDVTCKYDGTTALWYAELTSDCLALLSAKEKAGAVVEQLRTDLKRACNAASSVAADACDKAGKKFGELSEVAKKGIEKELAGLKQGPSALFKKSSQVQSAEGGDVLSAEPSAK